MTTERIFAIMVEDYYDGNEESETHLIGVTEDVNLANSIAKDEVAHQVANYNLTIKRESTLSFGGYHCTLVSVKGLKTKVIVCRTNKFID